MHGTILSIAGVATSGKDTFYTLLRTHLPNRTTTRYAYADFLKAELDPLFRAFGGTAFETDPVKKELQRPLLVSHGESQRIINPRHWIEKVEPFVHESLGRGELVVITDCRYANELDWTRSLGGKTVYVERILPDGSILPPKNDKEAANDPYLRANADVTVSWPTQDIHGLWVYIERAAKELGIAT